MDVSRSFEILEINPDSTFDEAKQAHRDLINVWHPDKYASNERLQYKATEKLKEVNAAWEVVHKYYIGKDLHVTSENNHDGRNQDTGSSRTEEVNSKQADSGRQSYSQKERYSNSKASRHQQTRTKSKWVTEGYIYTFRSVMLIIEVVMFVRGCYLVRHTLLTYRFDRSGYVGLLLIFHAIMVLPLAQTRVIRYLGRHVKK